MKKNYIFEDDDALHGFPQLTVKGVQNVMFSKEEDGKIKFNKRDLEEIRDGIIVSVKEYGFFVKFKGWGKEYEGLIHTSEFPNYNEEKELKEQCKEGDKIKVKILSAERNPRFPEAAVRIALRCVKYPIMLRLRNLLHDFLRKISVL